MNDITGSEMPGSEGGKKKQGLQAEAEGFLLDSVLPALPGSEARASQRAMAQACCRTIEDGGVLMVEAGTGTGKTFAYLIPLVLSGEKAIISTKTKNLQEQLVAKDLAFLSSLKKFSYSMAKGRSNYLCLRRLRSFGPQNEGDAAGHRALTAWADETQTGDFEELRLQRSPIHDRVCSDGDACRKMKCRFQRDCFYYKARQRWESSRIVVVNHALLAVNSMMPEDSKILPRADALVIDEAHSLDGVLSDQIGINLSRQRAEKILSRLLRPDERGVYKGLLAASPGLHAPFESLREEIGLFWTRVSFDLRNRTAIKEPFALEGRMRELAGSIRAFVKEIKGAAIGLFEEDEEVELGGAMLKLGAFADEMEVLAGGGEGSVRWPEIEEKRIGLRMVPMFPTDFMRDNIVAGYRSLILTSATLS
ncbi:MAG: ATP-dependent DNA helicase, partial [Nitrospirae bacterium]|nr:ATP-dependent DNA helicase [Nitrospirota bacterium]